MITQILAKNSQNKFLAHHITALGLGVAKGEFTRLSGGEKKNLPFYLLFKYFP